MSKKQKQIQTQIKGMGVFFVRKTHKFDGKLVTLIAGHFFEDEVPDIGTGSGQVWLCKATLVAGKIYKNPDNGLRIDQELCSPFNVKEHKLLSDKEIPLSTEDIEGMYFK